MNTDVLISFMDQSQMIDFCHWFKRVGFDQYMKSTFNGANSDAITCLETDEFPNHDDENFSDTQAFFELS